MIIDMEMDPTLAPTDQIIYEIMGQAERQFEAFLRIAETQRRLSVVIPKEPEPDLVFQSSQGIKLRSDFYAPMDPLAITTRQSA